MFKFVCNLPQEPKVSPPEKINVPQEPKPINSSAKSALAPVF